VGIRISLLLLLLVFVLLSTGAAALSAPRYEVQAATLAGGGYQLTTSESQIDNVAAGGAYRLLGPAAPELRGSGCCCTYLPCILRGK
jgi:hypothetical protein